MPYDKDQLRLERFEINVGYHAAYSYWTLRGVLAERWAHGPTFGASAEGPQAVTLLPADTIEDRRIWAVYGLRGTGMNAEGPTWVPRALEIYPDWISDALKVLEPRRIVRLSVDLFSLYPVSDPVQASRKLRRRYYRNEALQEVLPPSLQEARDRFHSAVDFIVPLDDHGGAVSLVAGAVGPPHRGTFFLEENVERDDGWWIGFRYQRRVVEPDGIQDADTQLQALTDVGLADQEHLVDRILTATFAEGQ